MTPEEIKEIKKKRKLERKKRKELEKQKKENISPELAASMAKVNSPVSTIVIGEPFKKGDFKKSKKKKKYKGKSGEVVSQSIRKAPRAARSANARRWKDLRESDGIVSPVITYKAQKKGDS